MNKLVKFFHELRHPHCEHCMLETQESKICDSCETLRVEVNRLRAENSRLLEAIIEKNLIKDEPTTPANSQARIPTGTHVSWNMRRQMLEQQDRHTARLMKENTNPINKITTEELEKELDLVGKAREGDTNAV